MIHLLGCMVYKDILESYWSPCISEDFEEFHQVQCALKNENTKKYSRLFERGFLWGYLSKDRIDKKQSSHTGLMDLSQRSTDHSNICHMLQIVVQGSSKSNSTDVFHTSYQNVPTIENFMTTKEAPPPLHILTSFIELKTTYEYWKPTERPKRRSIRIRSKKSTKRTNTFSNDFSYSCSGGGRSKSFWIWWDKLYCFYCNRHSSFGCVGAGIRIFILL